MKDLKDIRDDQIRVVGEESKDNKSSRNMYIIVSLIAIVVIGVVMLLTLNNKKISEQQMVEPSLFEPEVVALPEEKTVELERLGREVGLSETGFVEIKDTLINDVPIRIYIPHNATMSLHIGKLNRTDTTIIYAAQAADVRADNGGIVGAFVLKGEPKAWGLSKRGFCASIDGNITIGVEDNSPLFEEATETGGYFFRQYPLVKNGAVVENEIKAKSVRRSICDRNGEIFMVESLTKESFHDFSQVLVDLGVDQAIYLIGSSSYGWAVDENGQMHEFGEDLYYKYKKKIPRNISYLIWRKN